MSNFVDLNNLSKEIEKELTEYSKEVTENIKKAVNKRTREGVEELKKNSPNMTGDYSTGWRSRTEYEDARKRVKRIYNKTDYQIEHLLEDGHKNGPGGAWGPDVKAIPHIRKVEEKVIEELEKDVEEAVQSG